MPTIDTDYLVIGAGASGLSFTDELIRHANKTVTIADERAAPGGHWCDAYPFVTLHQPSITYGVPSVPLGDTTIDQDGPNEGYLSLAGCREVQDHFARAMRERLLPSGRVTYLPLTRAEEADGGISLRHLLSGERTNVGGRTKIVDATYFTNEVPSTHERKYAVADGVFCAPPNDLPRRAQGFGHYCVLGAGKTGIDSVLWLLANGITQDRITWVVPRDPWLWNRDGVQPTAERVGDMLEKFAARQEALAEAATPEDFAHRLEAADIWMRIDKNVEPGFFHAALVSPKEMTALRTVDDIVRSGRVTAIEPGKLIFANAEHAVPDDTFFIDCTASAVRVVEPKPIFEDNRVTLQFVRFPLVTLSAALIGFVEATLESDEEKNALIEPLRFGHTVADFIRMQPADLMNQFRCGQNKAVRQWLRDCRLNGVPQAALAAADQGAMMALGERIQAAAPRAIGNVPRILAEA